MTTLILTIHVIACVSLVLIVLLQTGKGADMGTAFGAGASQTLFGASGAGTVLSKITTAIAIIFLVSSLTLAYLGTNQFSKSVVNQVSPPVSQETKAPENTAPATK